MDTVAHCKKCRSVVQRGSRFCALCGHPIDFGAAESERRQLTLLFCDLVESTALSERLDPEDLHDLLTSYQRVCRDAIGRYEGHISQFLGDGIMSYFGYPIAHEDDAVRAVRAAIRLVEDVKLVNQGIGKRLNAKIHVRVGLHTGVVVVGEVGPGGAHDRLAVGDTVNLAARIQTFATIDTVVVSAATAQLIDGHFELESLGAHTLKGFSKPLELFRVLRSTGARSKFEAAARGKLTPHVGRENELRTLCAAWDEVQRGADRVVVVRGEAGIGKSRIVHHFRRTALHQGARVLECFCSPLAQATALAPIVEMLEGRILERADGNGSAAARLEALASMLGEHSRFGPDALPLMATLLSIPGAYERPLDDMSPLRRRARTLEIMRAWLASAAERVPVAMLVEDVHWADPSTLEFLDLLVRERPGGRTLVCVTARPEFRDRWRESHVDTVELGRLSRREVEAMLPHVTDGHALPALVVNRLIERSEGVPLFVEEVTKAVLESGALRLSLNRYELVRSLDEQFLPSTVQGSLVARFDRLGDSRAIAQLGAAIGREFAYPLIRAVSGKTDEELRQHLDRLSESELAFVVGEPPDAVYTFKHALIQDAIYATLLKSERARVHDTILAALEAQFPEMVANRPEIAAYHAENAGRRDRAVPLLRNAGVNALQRMAVAEAVKHLAHAIELVHVLDEPARTHTEMELQAAIGPAYMATVGWAAPEVEQASARLRDLAAATGDSTRVFPATYGLWTVDFLRGRLFTGLDLARQVLQMAEGADDPLLRVAGHHAVGYTHFYRGDYVEALRHAEQGLALFDLGREMQLVAAFQLSSSCALRCYRTQTLEVLGRHKEAAESLRAWRRLLDEIDHAPSLSYSLCQQCFLFHAQGDAAEVRSVAEQSRAHAIAEGFALWVPIADIFIAWAGAQLGGDATAAVESIRLSKKRVDRSLTFVVELELMAMLAETMLLAGQPEQVALVVHEALQSARIGGVRHYEPELFRLDGDAAAALGDTERAVACYLRGVASARELGAHALEMRSAAALARIDPYEDRSAV